MPLSGSVGNRISQLHHEQKDGTASRKRSNKQMIAIAFATKRRGKRKRK
jgi:type II secretory pathway component PulL